MIEKEPADWINKFVNQERLDNVVEWHNENQEKEHGNT